MPVRRRIEKPWALAPEGIFLSAHKIVKRMEKRTSAAEAGYGSVILRHG
jgi:hypothetical protein